MRYIVLTFVARRRHNFR